MCAIASLNQYGTRLRASDRPFPEIQGVELPRGASGANTPAREATPAELDGVDLLYIPGAPGASDSQVGDRVAVIPPPGTEPVAPSQKSGKAYTKYTQDHAAWTSRNRKWMEHSTRAFYELKLIEMARTRGIPVLAICAGSWRLLEAYGGRSRTLAVEVRGQHKAENVKDTWDVKHGINVADGTLLSNAVKPRTEGVLALPDANSTHWAAADTVGGKLAEQDGWSQRDEKPKTPSALLAVSAQAGDVVEAFETLFGAPSFGIQWHPECYFPGMKGENSGSSEVTNASLGIFEFMVYVAMVSRLRRGFVTGVLDREKVAFQALSMCARALTMEYERMTQLQREQAVKDCTTRVEANMPDRQLWSRRMDDLAEGLENLLKGQPTAAQEVLRHYA